MANERLAPDALLTSTNLSGAVTDIDEDPDSPDSNWLTADDDGTDTICRVSFPTPTANPTTGSGLQNFRAWLRRTNNSTREPIYDLELYENGSLVSQLIVGATMSHPTGIIVSATWDASSLSAGDGSNVECRIVGTRSGGPPSQRNTVEIGAIEWNCEYAAGSPPELGMSLRGG